MSLPRLKISPSIILQLRAAAEKGRPNEACGMLVGKDGVVEEYYELTNADASPEHFSLIPEEQFALAKKLRASKQQTLALWHSHPDTPARMSEEDLRLAFMPGIIHTILSLAVPEEQSLRGFVVNDGVPQEIELELK